MRTRKNCYDSEESSACSPNGKNRKRQRIDMPPKSTSKLAQTVAQLNQQMDGLGESVTGDDRRKRMRETWHQNRDAFLDLLGIACGGSLGSVNNDDFWKCFCKRLVKDLNLDIQITDETVQSCRDYGLELESLHKECQSYDTKMENIRRSPAYYLTAETKRLLYSIFGRTSLSIKRDMSTSASSSSGKSAWSSDASDSSVHMPYKNLKLRVTEAIIDLAATWPIYLPIDVVKKYTDYICEHDVLCMVFLKYDEERKVKWMTEFLENNK